jgi:shikimate dehydrogenase
MSDRYCVFGNPVDHSKSPAIHAAFAAQCRQDLSYEAILAPLDGFAESMRAFAAAGGCGANVTVPFKEQACRLATRLAARAELAGAVNTLVFNGPDILGDNTDGAGLLRDLSTSTWPVGSPDSACCCSARAAPRAASSGPCSTLARRNW